MKATISFIKLKIISTVFILFSGVFILTGISSCKKQSGSGFTDSPVIAAFLMPGQQVSVKISHKTPYYVTIQTDTNDLNNLNVIIVYQKQEYILTGLGGGIYSDIMNKIQVIQDSTYYLRLAYKGASVSSSTTIPLKPQGITLSATSIKFYQYDPADPTTQSHPTPITITWTNDDLSSYLITVTCVDSLPVSVFTDSIPENGITSSPPLNGTEFKLREMMFNFFGKNRVIIYHLPADGAMFFGGWMPNSQTYQEPPTNIKNGLGIFSGVNADTVYVQVIQQ